jgi:anti-sigma factor RsiW
MSDHPTIEQLSAFIDGELSLASREAVIAHIRGCPACAARQDELIEVAALLRSRPALKWTAGDSERVLAQIANEHVPRPRPRKQRDLTLPIAGALALIAVAAYAIVAPGLAGDGLSGSGFSAIAIFEPSGGLFSASHFLIALAVVAALGMAALPLIRAR